MTATVTVLFAALLVGNQASDTTRIEASVDVDRIAVTDPVGAPRGPLGKTARVAASVSNGPSDPTDSVAQRRRAVTHSDWYYRRLTIHKAASWATVPLFVTEYILGDKLFEGNASSGTKSAHQAVATGIGVLFGANTITGAWNLWDSRHESQGRARRITHAALMLVSDAGFVATASLAPEGDEGSEDRSDHRNVAIGSMGVALGSYLMMFLWK